MGGRQVRGQDMDESGRPPADTDAGACSCARSIAEQLAGVVAMQQDLVEVMRGMQRTLLEQGNAASVREIPVTPAALQSLTHQERRVLSVVSSGQSNRATARSLGISEKTVKNHLHNVFQKLGVSNRVEAALMMQSTS
ncbi:helix-turn-helix transcriptional regulator [Streptomyces sp. Ac-502]|uniref:helix-turn-helix domain-containing protein n=1 Tax=Streptomyces sp. Ac-502 TaxID=3342801 RepID=UPI003862B1B2